MSQIVHQLVLRLVSSLNTKMITEVPKSNRTRASLVKAYRFQDSPQENSIYLAVTGGNPNDTNLRDARISASEMEDLGMRLPIAEVGGGHLWWRRGRVILGCYFVAANEEEQIKAGEYAHEVLGRATYSIERTYVSDLVDDYGEQALMIICHANTFYESGGPPNQYIWRGEIHWQALTARPM